MAEIKEFVVNDRRKFTAEGEARPDAPPAESKRETRREPAQPPTPISIAPEPATDEPEAATPPPLTAEQTEQATRAYDATVDRLDTAIRATNPGMERMPEMNFERVVQSLYMQALFQLGGAAEPNQQPQVDILGARQTIDMLSAIAARTSGNLSSTEQQLTDNALFELRMAFLEVTQAIARQAQSRQQAQPPGMQPGAPPIPGGPSIVR